MKLSPSLLLLVWGAQSIDAFGWMGHQLAGALTQLHLSVPASNVVQLLLNSSFPQFHGQLSLGSPWPDRAKRQPQYSYTKNYHWINPINDNPPVSCTYDSQTECPKGTSSCVISAIANFSSILGDGYDKLNSLASRYNVSIESGKEGLDGDSSNVKYLISAMRKGSYYKTMADALLFFIHFEQDIHQPLHATGRDRGGNRARVRWNGRTRYNMHSVWDTLLIKTRLNTDFGSNMGEYLNYLNNVTTVNSAYQEQPQDTKLQSAHQSNWTACPSSEQRSADDLTASLCPRHWTQESNTLNCAVVWVGYDRNNEIGPGSSYFEQSYGFAEVQIQKAGFRGAAVLNALFPSKPSSGRFGEGKGPLSFSQWIAQNVYGHHYVAASIVLAAAVMAVLFFKKDRYKKSISI